MKVLLVTLECFQISKTSREILQFEIHIKYYQSPDNFILDFLTTLLHLSFHDFLNTLLIKKLTIPYNFKVSETSFAMF